MPNTAPCQYCNMPISARVVTVHERTRKRVPPPHELKAMMEAGMSQGAISRKYRVSGRFIFNQLERLESSATLDTRCSSCRIAVFDDVPARWHGLELKRVGDMCAWCARRSA